MKKSIIIKKIAEKNFVLVDEGKELAIKYDIKEEKVTSKEGEKINHWILLPENSIDRKGFKLEDFEGISEKEYFERKKAEKSEKSEKSEEFCWLDFLTEEEMKKYNELKEIGEKRIEKEKIKRENPKYKEMLSIKNQFDELIKIGYISENSEDYKKICEMIKNFKIDK